MIHSLLHSRFLRVGVVAGAFFAFAAAPALAQPEKAWLHVQVEGDSEDQRVDVNVPLAAAHGVVESLGAELFDEMVEEMNDEAENHLDELREVWQALRENPGTSIELSEEGDERLTAIMDGDEIRVEGRGDDGTLFIRVPVAFGDALFSGADPQELDFAAALETLSGHEGDLVSVKGDDGSVRVWVGPQR